MYTSSCTVTLIHTHLQQRDTHTHTQRKHTKKKQKRQANKAKEIPETSAVHLLFLSALAAVGGVAAFSLLVQHLTGVNLFVCLYCLALVCGSMSLCECCVSSLLSVASCSEGIGSKN